MELHYTPTKHILIEGHKCCSVAVPLNRCPLSKLSKIYMDQQQSTVNNLELNKICSEHIANSVDLRWHLLGTDTKGKVSLKGITLTPNMLDLVRMSPLNWSKLLFYTCNFYSIPVLTDFFYIGTLYFCCIHSHCNTI